MEKVQTGQQSVLIVFFSRFSIQNVELLPEDNLVQAELPLVTSVSSVSMCFCFGLFIL